MMKYLHFFTPVQVVQIYKPGTRGAIIKQYRRAEERSVIRQRNKQIKGLNKCQVIEEVAM